MPKHPELHQHGLFPLRKTGFLIRSPVAAMSGLPTRFHQEPQKLTALDTLKKSLLHQAFSGQL
jgi:hypothetical protein